MDSKRPKEVIKIKNEGCLAQRQAANFYSVRAAFTKEDLVKQAGLLVESLL